MRNLSIWLAVPMAGLPILLAAEELKSLEVLTVTARPSNSQSLEHIAQPATVLAGEELRRKQRGTIGETLSNELGVTASDFGQGASRPIIRGLGGQRLRMLQNGLGSMDISSISVDHNVSLSPFSAEQIEILRGPATLLYGNGASAGIVNVVSQRIPEQLSGFSGDLDLSYDSAGQASRLNLKAGASAGEMAFHVDALKLDSDDYSAHIGKIRNSDVEIDDVSFGTSWVADWGFIGASFGHYASIYGVPFNPEEADELVFIDLEQDRFDLAGQIKQPFAAFDDIRFRAAYNDYDQTEFEGPGMPGTVFSNREVEARIEANHAAFHQWQGALGAHYRYRDFSADGEEAFIIPAELQSIGVFVFEDTDWQNWHFEAGFRYEFQQLDPSTIGNKIEHHSYSLAAGAVVELANDFNLGISLGRSQRAPSLEELLAMGPHLATETFEVGDQNLDIETSNNLDLSLGQEFQAASWQVNLFANYIEDFIFQQFQDQNNDGLADQVDEERELDAGDLFLINYVQADALFYGLEAELKFDVFDLNGTRLDARLFTDVVWAALEEGDDLPRISPPRLGGRLNFQQNNWYGGLDLIRVFEQDRIAQLETETAGYTLLNFDLNYQFAVGEGEAGFYLQANNLLDEDARRHTSVIKDRAPLPGRSLMAGLRFSY